MKINTKNVIIAFLVIMSLTSYIFLSNIEVNDPTPLNESELLEQYGQPEANVYLPDVTLLTKALDVLRRAATL